MNTLNQYVVKNSRGLYFTQNGQRSDITHRPCRGWTTNIDEAKRFNSAAGASNAVAAAYPQEPGVRAVAVEVTVDVVEVRNTVAA